MHYRIKFLNFIFSLWRLREVYLDINPHTHLIIDFTVNSENLIRLALSLRQSVYLGFAINGVCGFLKFSTHLHIAAVIDTTDRIPLTLWKSENAPPRQYVVSF